MKFTSFKFKLAVFAVSILGFSTFSFRAGARNTYGIMPQATPSPVVRPTVKPPPGVITGKAIPQPQSTPVPESLSDLQTKIQSRLSRPEVRRGQIGLKIVSLNSGKVIFEQNGEKYLMPASNMKNFTVAAAMEKLTPDFRFVTSVYALSPPDASGTIKGDLRIYGRGDISISTAFFGTSPSDPETYYKGIDRLVDKIVVAGVKRIEGDLIGDESYFRGDPIPGSWEYDDLQWYYGAEISALPINDNAVDLTIKPGATQGGWCDVKLLPANSLLRIDNRCQTVSAGQPNTLEIEKRPNENLIKIRGALGAGDKGFSGSIAISHPAELFLALLRQRLQERGVTVTGQTRAETFDSVMQKNRPPSAQYFGDLVPLTNSPTPSGPIEITKLESPPFSEIAAKTMKPSQNMYTETILWTLGEWLRKEDIEAHRGVNSISGYLTQNSADIGLAATRAFRSQIGIPDDAVIQHDGCGLSRHDLITPSAVVQLYTYMAKQSKYAQAWRDALTIAGVDGTLRNRFKGTPGAGNIRGKTGTIDQVSALSGYLTTAGGEAVVFSVVVNGVPDGGTRVALIDEIILNVVNFSGKID